MCSRWRWCDKYDISFKTDLFVIISVSDMGRPSESQQPTTNTNNGRMIRNVGLLPQQTQQASRRQHADQKVARPCSCPRSGRPYSFIGLWRVSRRPRQNSHTHDGHWPPDKREPSCSPCPADSVTPTRTLGVSFSKVPLWIETLSLSLDAPLQLIDELQLGSAGESCLRVFVCEWVHLFCVVAVFESANDYSIDERKKDPQGGTTLRYIQMEIPVSSSLIVVVVSFTRRTFGTLGHFNCLHVNRWQWPREIFNCPWSLKPQI